MFSSRAASALAFALLLAVGCSGRPERKVERLAILPPENLTADAAIDWAAAALPRILASQLSASKSVFAFPAQAIRDGYGGRATQVLHSYLTVEGNAYRLTGAIEDLGSRKAVRQIVLTVPRNKQFFQALTDALAKQIDPRTVSTRSYDLEALRHFGSSLLADGASKAAEALQSAIAADPNFGAAYLALAQHHLARNDLAQAEAVLNQGLQHDVGDADRARLELMAASIRQDAAAQFRALSTLATLLPADADTATAAGEAAARLRDYKAALKWQEEATSREPTFPLFWNALGYARAMTGDLEGATEALRHYESLAPKDANALDSLGDIHFVHGRFQEAEQFYLQALEKNPNFQNGAAYAKAAHAAWRRGDLTAADEHFRKFASLQPGPFQELRTAQWEHMTGRHKQAIGRLEILLPRTTGEPASIFRAQLAAWKLEAGQREEAIRLAEDAMKSATVPRTLGLAAVVRFAATALGSPDTIKVLATRHFPAPSGLLLQKIALAYAYIITNDFRAAESELRALARQPDATIVPVLLAWSMIECGRVKEALAELPYWPIPQVDPDNPLAALAASRLFYIRGTLLKSAGNEVEARAALEKHLQFSGDLPTIFKDRDKVQQLLNR